MGTGGGAGALPGGRMGRISLSVAAGQQSPREGDDAGEETYGTGAMSFSFVRRLDLTMRPRGWRLWMYIADGIEERRGSCRDRGIGVSESAAGCLPPEVAADDPTRPCVSNFPARKASRDALLLSNTCLEAPGTPQARAEAH